MINQEDHRMKVLLPFILIVLAAACAPIPGETSDSPQDAPFTYPIVDTGVSRFYSDTGMIASPAPGQPFYGQDAQYQNNIPSYTDQGDGTVTDHVTGLMWQKEMGSKLSFEEARLQVGACRTGGYSDWRIPTIKELYSLILFTGQIAVGSDGATYTPYIDTAYFNQPLGDTSLGEREIDAQTWSCTEYLGRTMHSDETVFGVNFIDGRIKGYPKVAPRSGEANKMYFRYVRGNPLYGQNQFVDKGDGTVSDQATGLMWLQADDGEARNWQEALAYAENLELASHSDWRLPSAKELQSIVDYTRAPSVSASAAISPLFGVSEIRDPAGNPGQYPYFWTSTTHLDGVNPAASAVYIAFGKALGLMNGELLDVHGAGAQRSDPKSGDADDYPQYFGPQGDLRMVYNHVRCVRTME